jgi:DNA processing protein
MTFTVCNSSKYIALCQYFYIILFYRQLHYLKILMLTTSVIPDRLREIPDPPKSLFIVGKPLEHLLDNPCVAIVGSRKVTSYGKAVTHAIAYELARAGVVIISGLALGVDGIAHRAALEAKGQTIAVLPGSLARIHPGTHAQLARRIVEQGGALVSEYSGELPTMKWNFVQRNRLVSGLSDLVLITEAGQKSGTLHTAKFALEQGRDVGAIPGNITSSSSVGANTLIKTGAALITSAQDILHMLGVQAKAHPKSAPEGDTPEEQILLNLIHEGTSDGSELLVRSKLEVTAYNQTITMLEITGKIRSLGSNHWSLN